MLWTMITGWLCEHWLWVLGLVALLIVGIVAGWRLAALLGVGGIAGSAGKVIGEVQKRREIEGRRLDQERHELKERAKETDAMIDNYYRKKRGG